MKREQMAFVNRLMPKNFDIDRAQLVIEKFNCTIQDVHVVFMYINRKAEHPISPSVFKREYVLFRDGNVCQYCGSGEGKMILEHIIPKSMGGDSRFGNMVCACVSCNMSKKRSVWIPKNIELLRRVDQKWYKRIISMATFDSRLSLPKHKINKKRLNRSPGEWRRVPIIRIDEGGEIKKYASITDATIDIGASLPSISLCLSGKTKTSHNFKWEYEKSNNA